MLLFINLRLPLRDTGREGLPRTDRILTALQVRLLPQEAEALTTICRLRDGLLLEKELRKKPCQMRKEQSNHTCI